MMCPNAQASLRVRGFLRAVFFGLVLVLGSNSAALGDVPTRESIVQSLRHQETLVRSAVIEFEVSYHPTRSDQVGLIHQFGRRHGVFKEVTRAILTQEVANQKAYGVRWWRKGEKERVEKFRQGKVVGESADSIEVYDGQFVRRLNRSNGQETGTISTAHSSAWKRTDRLTPFSLIYEWTSIPYSDIVEHGRNYDVTLVPGNGPRFAKVMVGHPTNERRSFMLGFDAEWRIVERETYGPLLFMRDRHDALHKRSEFSDYRRHTDDSSGEAIWFPYRSISQFYLGETPEGTPIPYLAREVNTRRADFNRDIPDDMFVVSFPADADVWDDINTPGGWLGPDDPLRQPDRGTGRWRVILIAVNVLAVLAIGVVLGVYQWRKRKSGG